MPVIWPTGNARRPAAKYVLRQDDGETRPDQAGETNEPGTAPVPNPVSAYATIIAEQATPYQHPVGR